MKMNSEIEKIFHQYNITIGDMNEVYYCCVANRKDDAIKYLQPKVGFDYKTAEMIVNDYLEDYSNEISECQNSIRDYQNRKQMEELNNKPKCPTCNSTNLRKISTVSKAANTALFGMLGTKRYRQFHCNNCGYEW